MSDTDGNAVIKAWHFTNGDTLRDGTPVPPVGEWRVYGWPIVYCKKGLHASRLLLDALHYAPGSTVHRVECRYDVEEGPYKLVCRERRRTASADIRDLLRDFARFCAWTVLPLWDAPPVVKQWIETGDETIRKEARDAARAAYDAATSAAYLDAARATYMAACNDTTWNAYMAVYMAADGAAEWAAFNSLLADAVTARLQKA